jgi:hypothetical protein
LSLRDQAGREKRDKSVFSQRHEIMTAGYAFVPLNRRRRHPLAWLSRMSGAAAAAALPTVMDYDRWYYSTLGLF